MYDGKIYAWESIGFITMYVVYLIVLIGGFFINRRLKDRRALLQATTTQVAAKTYGSVQIPTDPIQAAVPVDNDVINSNDQRDTQLDVTLVLSLRRAFLPREEVPWNEKSLFNRIITIFKVNDLLCLLFNIIAMIF
jgi:hypothetical protein